MKRILVVSLVLCSIISCGKGETDKLQIVDYMPKMDNVSLSYRGQVVDVEIPTNDVDVRVKHNSYWIQQLQCNSNMLTFYAVENNEKDRGYRTDTIIFSRNNIDVGELCVVQARSCISDRPLKWALPEALYYAKELDGERFSGQEITEMVYRLEETTYGEDTYKNYPAFAYCIEMNIDPENNMEWHLPDIDSIIQTAEEIGNTSNNYLDTPFGMQDKWWSASDRDGDAFWLYSGNSASRGPIKKSNECYVMAFRNGKIVNPY